MSDATYQSKVYEKQGGEEIVVASGGKVTVESGGVIDASAGTLTLGPGAVTPAKMSFTGLKVLAHDARNGAGAVTLTGAAVGDRVIAIFGAPTAGGALAACVSGTDFESTITVVNQIQQVSASDLSAVTIVAILIRAPA